MATVLVVDDRATNREVTRATLDHGGYQVIEAREGREALALACGKHPDLVVADVLMPGMDGYEFVQNLRSNPDTAYIPVLFYTANYREEEAQPLAGLFGVSRVISKSADPLELLDAVAEALRPCPATAATATTGTQTTVLGAQHLYAVNAKLLEKVQALDESEARFRVLAESSPMGMVIGDPEGVATYVNPRLSQITQVPADELLGHGWLRYLSPESRRSLREAHQQGFDSGIDGLRYHGTAALPDGEQRCLTVLIRFIQDSEGAVTGFVAMIDDVTTEVAAQEHRRAEEQEREAEARRQVTARFDSLARLAGGVAHDFNNLLNVIMSTDELVREGVAESIGEELTAVRAEVLLRDLDEIYRAGQRAAHLTHQLLTFGGREVVTPAVVDVNALIREVQGMIAGTIGRRLSVTTKLDPHLSHVHVDAAQLCQVLLNLVANANDAMPEGGRLHLETANIRIGSTGDLAGLGAGEYVHIAVADTGHGMPAEVVEHAMEPFFTTKPSGQGTGLGLATAYGVVTQAGGELVIDSGPGRGTTMHIYLPATRRPIVDSRPVSTAPTATGHTVLVAEDNDELRAIVIRLLTRAGYRVLAAANGREALEAAKRHDGVIDALLTDVVMPVMNGRELAEALHRVRPGVPILYMSGYAAPIMTEQGLFDPDVTLLSKPFTKTELLDAVQATLSSRSTADSAVR